MLNKKKIFQIFLLYLTLFSSALADNKIVYLDLDFLLKNINLGKKTFENLRINENNKNEEFILLEKNLKDEENKILASRNIITEEEFKKNIDKFILKMNNYSNSKNEEIEKLKQIRNKEVLNLLKKINPVIQSYMDNNSISIIIDKKNVYIANIEYDITNKLIEIINKKF